MEFGAHLPKTRTLVALFVAVGLALLFCLPAVGARGPRGTMAVATESPEASRAALAILRRGGSAADAAITAALVAGVASPTSSGIGGGGFALTYDAASRSVSVLDFRETAPRAVRPEVFERRPLADAERGHLAGVPGEVAGLFELHERYGKLPWKALVAPAVRAANKGYPVNRHVAMVLGFMGARLGVDPSLGALFLPGGKARAAGAWLRNPKLGKTLERIAAEGPKALYAGAVAADIVRAAREQGSPMTEDDLARYAPVDREPITVDWEGYRIFTMPPPSAGGLMLAQTLSLFDATTLERLDFGSGPYVHLLAEAARGAYADRMRYVGDPDHVKVDLPALLSDVRLAKRRKVIALDRTHALPRFGLEEHGTHHLVTADASGNVVSLTTTVNRPFGSRIVAPNSGVVLNDELDDFSAAKDVAPFGMKQSPNRPRPGARPVSSMTPTLVTRAGSPVLALGGSGGLTIATNVTQVTLARLAFGADPSDAVAAKRFSIPTRTGTIALPRGSSPDLIEDLRFRGEIVATRRFDAHAVQLIAIDGGQKVPVSDPRKHGVALAR